MKNLLYVLLIPMFIGCASKKYKSTIETYSSENIKLTEKIDSLSSISYEKDTIYKEVIVQQDQSVEIDNPCDSLTGLLKKVNITAGKTTVKSEGNKLMINTSCDEVEKVYEGKLRDKETYINELRLENETLKQERSSSVDGKVVKVKWYSLKQLLIDVLGLIIMYLLLKFVFKIKWL